MKVIMLLEISGPVNGELLPGRGEVADVEDIVGQGMIDSGQAVALVDGPIDQVIEVDFTLKPAPPAQPAARYSETDSVTGQADGQTIADAVEKAAADSDTVTPDDDVIRTYRATEDVVNVANPVAVPATAVVLPAVDAEGHEVSTPEVDNTPAPVETPEVETPAVDSTPKPSPSPSPTVADAPEHAAEHAAPDATATPGDDDSSVVISAPATTS